MKAMTHTSTEQAEARDLAYWIAHTTDNPTAALIQSLHARVQELEASQAQRVPLTRKQINECSRDAQIAFCMDKHPTYEVALTREVERLLGITQEKQG